jgi:hypothetical protein
MVLVVWKLIRGWVACEEPPVYIRRDLGGVHVVCFTLTLEERVILCRIINRQRVVVGSLHDRFSRQAVSRLAVS